MSTPIEMRKYLAYMRNGTPITESKKVEEVKKDMTMRDMLGKMRKIKGIKEPVKGVKSLNEDVQPNMSTTIDKKDEEQKMSHYFDQNNVTIEYNELNVYSNGVMFSGTIDNQIQFVYKVTPQEESSGVEINYLDDFDAQDPENEDVVNKIEDYYNIFYKYWRDQLFN